MGQAGEGRDPSEGREAASEADLLAEYRAGIDAIDDGLHDLLMQRTRLVEQIAAIKRRVAGGAGLAMRPAREAMILRRLLARHEGALPPDVVAAVWRALTGAYCALEGPFGVLVHGGRDPAALLDLARFHFGTLVPLAEARSGAAVVAAVGGGSGLVGVVPLPGAAGEAEPWWPALATGAPGRPRIIARLPFLRPPAGAALDLEAFALAPLRQEPTGLDRTLLVLAADPQTAPALVLERCARAGLRPVGVAEAMREGGRLHLLEHEGFLAEDDARLAALPGRGILHAWVIGGYAEQVRRTGAPDP